MTRISNLEDVLGDSKQFLSEHDFVDTQDFLKYLRSRHERRDFAVHLMPQDEYRNRLNWIERFLEKAQANLLNFCLDLFTFAIAMQASLDLLEALILIPDCFSPITNSIDPTRIVLDCFFGSYFRSAEYGVKKIEYSAAARTPKGRDKSESAKARRRDGDVCIVTGATLPDVCHIVPFSWTSCDFHRDFIQTTLASAQHFGLPGLNFQQRCQMFRANGGADKAWNMLCLSPLLHKLWGKAQFGFKLIRRLDPTMQGLVPVELQFRWFRSPADGEKPNTPIDLATEQDYANCRASRLFHDYGYTNGSVRFAQSGHIVRSGHLCRVMIPLQDVDNFEAMIETKWAACTLAAMSAAANDYKDGESSTPTLRTDRVERT
ncbi:hypothetical protein CP532_2727 [Ophiocordyceps camponoti-leonardi (nom. inval.)]|nr:hypothetical protein CP532_2727 [Ophiocordyceps camponoti-leonardi (nom. inval.)]